MNGHILETLTGIAILFNWSVLIKLICRINAMNEFYRMWVVHETLLTIPSQAPIRYKTSCTSVWSFLTYKALHVTEVFFFLFGTREL